MKKLTYIKVYAVYSSCMQLISKHFLPKVGWLYLQNNINDMLKYFKNTIINNNTIISFV